MKIIRAILSRLILFLNWVFSPRPMKRSDEEQRKVDAQTKDLILYQFHGCPFCIKVRREIKRLNLSIELRNANENDAYAKELIAGGGKRQVPCLRIVGKDGNTQWMYESKAVSNYLIEKFSKNN